MLLLWTENLRVGVEDFDEDHKKLIALVNMLHGAIETGNSKNMLESVLDDLEHYAWHHCTCEEVAFFETGYPDAAAHTAEHDELRRMVAKMKLRRESGTDADLSVDVMNLIYIWLTNHIYCADRKYSEFTRARGILQALPEPAASRAVRYPTPARFLASDAPGANHEAIAQSESIVPIIASESVMGTSIQRAASILSATKASSAPNP
ncbi:MAG TPA: bacteriohemerythrin [Terracidiphilus sp.]|nr:bacteriohemerythrin [Terracidiphilus sp.]